MPDYKVTVPVTIYVTYTVKAEGPDEALEEQPPRDAIYPDATGGLSPKRGVRIGYLGRDSWKWEDADAEEVE